MDEMLKVMGGRGKGKTTYLVMRSARTQTYILTLNKKRAKEISRIADTMGLHIPYPITLEEYLHNKLRGTFITNILIDDADDILQALFSPLKIDAITMTLTE